MAAGGTATLNLSLNSPAGSEPAAMQWTMSYPAANVSNLSVVAGLALTNAGKTINCAGGAAAYTCVASGVNLNTVANGVVAQVAVTLSGGSGATIGVASGLGAALTSNALTVSSTGGTVSVTGGGPVTLSSLSCAAGSLAPGASTTCTVTLSGAVTSAVTVGLSSNSPSVSVPQLLTISSGSTGTFTATASQFTTDSAATLTASLAGVTRTAGLTLVAPKVSSLSCGAASLLSNSSTTCTVTLSQAAPAAGSVVALSRDVTALNIPFSVPVQPNNTTATFTASTGAIAANQTATITASLNGASRTATIALTTTVTLTLSSMQCTFSILTPGTATSCSVTLSGNAPTGGTTVSLSSNNLFLTVPSSIAVGAGSNSASFSASAGLLTIAVSPIITARLGTSSLTTTISLVLSPTLVSLNCTPATLFPGAAGTCTTALNAPFATGNSVSLRSTVTALTVPATVTIPPGVLSATFGFTTTTALAGAASVRATFKSAILGFTFGFNPTHAPETTSSYQRLKPRGLSCSPTYLIAGSRIACELGLTGDGADSSDSVDFAISSSSVHLKVPAVVSARAGQTRIRFEATADADAAEGTAVLEARLGADAVQDTVSVLAPDSPALEVPRRETGKPGAAVRFTAAASDGHGLPVTLSASGLPAGARFDAATGEFEWLPTETDLGSYAVTITAANSLGRATSKPVSLFVGTGAPVVDALENAASQAAPSSCSPGAAATLSGSFLFQGPTPMTRRSGGATGLGGTRVLVNRTYTTVLSSSGGRVDFLCPALAPGAQLEIAVETADGISNPIQTVMEEAAPGLFTVDDSGAGQALAVRPDSELAALSNFRFRGNPALPGELVSLLATGIDCRNGVQRPLLRFGQTYARIESLRPSEQNAGACEILAAVPFQVSGDAVPLTLEVVRSDGRAVSSNRTWMAVEAGR